MVKTTRYINKVKSLSKKARLLFLSLFFAVTAPVIAWACHPGCCVTEVIPVHIITREVIRNEHRHLQQEVFGETFGIPGFRDDLIVPDGFFRLRHHERWLAFTFFEDHILPDLMMMTEQLATVMMEQMFIVGTFLDAKMQQETQLLFQKLTARAHKDYHPTFGMCEIGGNTRSLGAAEMNAGLSQMVLNKQFLDRQVGRGASVGAGGPSSDRQSDAGGFPTTHNRLGHFIHNTCDDNDLNKLPGRVDTGMFLCAQLPPPNLGWSNRDIDWNNTVMSPRVVNVDYDASIAYNFDSSSDNERLFQMSNYLYGHDVFTRPEGTLLQYERNHDNFLRSRAVTAKRSVAQTSFNSIVGLKSRGTTIEDLPGSRLYSSEETFDYVRFFMVELGFPLDDPVPYRQYLYHKNEAVEPPGAPDPERDELSYYAQMELLAKKIYQRPEFYTELYDKPANIKRKSAAMQAIKLMLDRDIFESQIRSEAIMSMILEVQVTYEQQNVENILALMKEKTR